jgi:KUP system potassium uptake protein
MAAAAASMLPTAPSSDGKAVPLVGLSVGALGVVYGDIGTSPLYAVRECFHATLGIAPTPANVLGVVSLFFWSLVLVVVVKYVTFVLRADHDGEGGILALLALAKRHTTAAWVIAAGLFGAALLYADGVLTPAISVLSAVEGLGYVAPGIAPWVVPVAVAILLALFAVQRRGTARVGAWFGPVMLVWFLAIGVLGARAIAARPDVLAAVSPVHAARFFGEHGLAGFWVLGSVVLCVTGGEALYADMGHFGRRPIRLAWLAVAFPALLLAYFGQGAALLADPAHAHEPFYALVPETLRFPMVVLATAATVIASQALISGAFSITRQAVQLGYLPRVRILHTSKDAAGQIYLPGVNALLAAGCVGLVVSFGSSSALAGAYGIAVTGTMLITTVLFFFLARHAWGAARALPLVVALGAVDLAFLVANAKKIPDGGWFPLAVGVGLFVVMTTWKIGRAELAKLFARDTLPLEVFLADVGATSPVRVPGTAVFMTASARGVPGVLLHHFKHNKSLHERVVLLSVVTEPVPFVPRADRLDATELDHGFWRVVVHYGYMQSPRITSILRAAATAGLRLDPADTSYYLGREKLAVARTGVLARWRAVLFAFLSRNASAPTDYFELPPNRVVEMGTVVEI